MADDRAPDPADVFALLDDEFARSVLVALSHRPMTATELSDRCEMSTSTVYRRLERLEQCDLVTSETCVDPDGHHRETYEACLDELRVELDDGGFDVRVVTDSRTEEFADAFTHLWEGL